MVWCTVSGRIPAGHHVWMLIINKYRPYSKENIHKVALRTDNNFKNLFVLNNIY